MPLPTGFAHAYLEIEAGARPRSWAHIDQFEWEPPLQCWFNPKDYTISKGNNWNAQPVNGQDYGTLQFTGGSPASLSLELVFDAVESNQPDVSGIANQLMGIATVNQPGSDQNQQARRRPPAVRFGWKGVVFTGVVKQLTLQFTLFDVDGSPIRAHVKLELMQVGAQTRRQNPTTAGTAGVRSATVRDGDSLQSIAYDAYGDPACWRLVAEANGIDDPMRVERGAVLSLPRGPA
ncbi:MAG: CIS tube protein [Gaiellales bacterium]